MKRRILCTSFALAAGLAAGAASAAEPVRVELVDNAALENIRGRYLGNNMIVGLQLELLSLWQSSSGDRLGASGALQLQQTASGWELRFGAESLATAGDGAAPAPNGGATATGGNGLQISGIGQVSQIAGDNNRMRNVTLIDFAPREGFDAALNGSTSSQAQAGDLHASISFGGGAQLGLQAPGSTLSQTIAPGVGDQSGRIMQIGQLTGNNQAALNSLQLHLITAALPANLQAEQGVQQALSLLPPKL